MKKLVVVFLLTFVLNVHAESVAQYNVMSDYQKESVDVLADENQIEAFDEAVPMADLKFQADQDDQAETDFLMELQAIEDEVEVQVENHEEQMLEKNAEKVVEERKVKKKSKKRKTAKKIKSRKFKEQAIEKEPVAQAITSVQSECKKINDVSKKDECYFNQAVALNSTDDCFRIKDTDQGYICEAMINLSKDPYKVCSGLKSSLNIGKCFFEMSKSRQLIELCDEIGDLELRKQCKAN